MSVRLVRAAYGSLWFPNSVVAKSPGLRAYVEQRRIEGERLYAEHERLHARNMALLGEAPEPARPREVVPVVRVESEEELWRAWRAYPT